MINHNSPRSELGKTVLFGALLAAALLSGGFLSARAEDGRAPRILPPQAESFGHTYGEWSAAWWQWLFSLPTTHHPLFDTAEASAGQHGRVWFLGGTFAVTIVGNVSVGRVTREVTIPAGKALFFPILNSEYDNVGCPGSPVPPTSFSVEQLRALVSANQDLASAMTCTIDGVPVPGLTDPIRTPFRVSSPVFGYNLPANNNVEQYYGLDCVTDPTGQPIQVQPAVADGVFILLAPLPPGHHTIHFGGSVGNPVWLIQDITYHINVVD